jgi:hypothetical protein
MYELKLNSKVVIESKFWFQYPSVMIFQNGLLFYYKFYNKDSYVCGETLISIGLELYTSPVVSPGCCVMHGKKYIRKVRVG